MGTELQNDKHTGKFVLWAIDPFETNAKPDQNSAAKLLKWTKLMGYGLQPAYVLSLLERTNGKFAAEDIPYFTERVEKATRKYLEDLGLTSARPLELLIADSASRKEAIQQLVDLADRLSSPWIVVSSHGRTGLSRLTFGSFAENLLLQAKRPILFLSHDKEVDAETETKKVLFPTDFSKNSMVAYRDVLKTAKAAGQEIVLFYSNNIPAIFYSAFEAPIVIPSDYFETQERDARAEADIWINLARVMGVPAKLIFKTDAVVQNIGDTILKVAHDEGINLISLACATGALTAFAAGSVARDVFRKSRCPVLVYGPKTFATKQEPSVAKNIDA